MQMPIKLILNNHLFQQFNAVVQASGFTLSANRYDALKLATKPDRRTVEREIKLPWKELLYIAEHKKYRRVFKPTEYPNWKIPRILIFDIETSPMEVLVWGLYEQRISPDNVKKEWSVLSWSAKWLFDSEIMGSVVTPEQAKNRTDKSVITSIWKLIDEADIIIAHNPY